MHSVGKVRLVFSTREKPQAGRTPAVQKILMTNDLKLNAATVIELYQLRWQIELFFKELKSTLGFDQYRFRRFEQVEGWLELTLVTFLYLEWHRAIPLKHRRLPKKEKEKWRFQRTHGLYLAIRRQTERADLHYLSDALQSKSGIRRLRCQLDQATQAEYHLVC